MEKIGKIKLLYREYGRAGEIGIRVRHGKLVGGWGECKIDLMFL